MTWCLPTRLTTTETTCPMKSCTPRGGKGRWPSSELTLCTFGWKASGTTSTWIWKLPASWWRLDFSYRLWGRGALSRCRLSHPRISVFIKARYDPTKVPQWLFRPAKVWWVLLLPPVVRPWGQGCREGSKWQDWAPSPIIAVQISLLSQSRRKIAKQCFLRYAGRFLSPIWKQHPGSAFCCRWSTTIVAEHCSLETVRENLRTSLKTLTSLGMVLLWLTGYSNLLVTY